LDARPERLARGGADMSIPLEERVQLIADELDIVRVLNRYAHGIDYGDEDDWLDCFTEDAVWEARSVASGSMLMRHAGRASLKAFVSGHTRPPELYHKHLVAEPIVTVDRDRATAVCYLLLVVAGPGGLPAIASFGRYRDELRRCTDGKWRIAHRAVEAEAWNPAWGELRNRRRARLGVSDGQLSGSSGTESREANSPP